MSNKQTDFKPSANQLKMLAVVQAADYGISVVAACTAAGIGRQTYYDWFDDSEFVTWWMAQQERHFALSLAQVYGAMRQSALGLNKDANPQTIKLMLERFDKAYVPRSKQEVQGTVDISFEDRLERLRIAAAAEAQEEADGHGD